MSPVNAVVEEDVIEDFFFEGFDNVPPRRRRLVRVRPEPRMSKVARERRLVRIRPEGGR